jgi:methylenetetrahydrofolate dehydrogenase (NADP+) / methenyltetrahydrofolate cyclohydrolase
MILYGAPVREEIKRELIERVGKLGRKPCLAVVQVGDREDSNIYVRNKKKFGEEIGIEVRVMNFKYQISNIKLEEEIKKLNNGKSADGIIVQLPLPEGFDTEKIINLIDKNKDADGLARGGAIPATARGVMTLLDFYKIEVAGKKVAVIGQGILAGRPIADELEKRGAEVMRCDINTKNIPEIARSSDVLISAVGKRNLITKEFLNNKQIIIDVGNDVDFAEVEPLVYAITPVPGGVGPLTVACLFQNLLDLV